MLQKRVHMIEIPEVIVLADQSDRSLKGKAVTGVIAAASPHKFAFYFGNPEDYDGLLKNRVIQRCYPQAGRVEYQLDGACISFNDGVNLRYIEAGQEIPENISCLYCLTTVPSLSLPLPCTAV